MFVDMKWELALKMHPNNYAYVQRALAQLCVEWSHKDVLAGWAIKCPNLVREEMDGLTVRSVSKEELLAAEGRGREKARRGTEERGGRGMTWEAKEGTRERERVPRRGKEGGMMARETGRKRPGAVGRKGRRTKIQMEILFGIHPY